MPTQNNWTLAFGLGACLFACAPQTPLTVSERGGKPQSMSSATAGRSATKVDSEPVSGSAGAADLTGLLVPPAPPKVDPNDADGGVDSNCAVGSFCPPAEPDPEDCGKLTLQAEAKTVDNPGTVLLIFDRSGSMKDDWNGMPKWQAAGTAVVSALQPLQDKLTIGAELFPSPPPPCDPAAGDCTAWSDRRDRGPSCMVNPITAADEVNFKPGASALSELQSGNAGSPKYQPQQGGGTPTSEALQQADAALRATTRVGKTAAIIITDGEPNCAWDQAQSTAILMDWATSLGVQTYVIGLPGAANGDGPAVLTALAQAGQTTDYVTPTDAAALQSKLSDIISQTVTKGFNSCSIKLDPAAKVPDKLHMIVKSQGQEQDVPHVFSGQTTDAWSISADGTSVELFGNLCENVKAGTYESITFVFGCVSVPPLPPPHAPPGPS